MTDLKPMWDRIAVALPKVLEGWSVEFPNWFTLEVHSNESLELAFDIELPLEVRCGIMRIMDELEARRLACFDVEAIDRGSEREVRSFVYLHNDYEEIANSATYPISDIATPYVECLMLTLEALANEKE